LRARSIDHCSPAFPDWANQKAKSPVVDGL
jgi:hypothetical protein